MDDAIRTGLTLDELRRRYPLEPRKDESHPGARISSTFTVEGMALDPSRCTEAIGLEPTEVKPLRERGHHVPSGRPNVLPPSWTVKIVQEPSYEIDACLSALLDLVCPREQAIRRFVTGNHLWAGFRTWVVAWDDDPIYSLSATTIRRLAGFGYEWSLGGFEPMSESTE